MKFKNMIALMLCLAMLGSIVSPSVTLGVEVEDKTVEVTDLNLLNYFYEQIPGKVYPEPIKMSEIQALTNISPEKCSSHMPEVEIPLQIMNIDPLKYATNTTWLSLVNQGVTDLSPIAYMTKLEHLDLRNQVKHELDGSSKKLRI